MIASPLEFSNCYVWLDASDVTTMGVLSADTPGNVTNNANVGIWANKATNSGNPLAPFYGNFVSPYALVSPTFIESLSCVRFSHLTTPDYLWCPLDTFSPRLSTSGRTIFLYCKINASTPSQHIYYETGVRNLSGNVYPFYINSNAINVNTLSYGVSGTTSLQGFSNGSNLTESFVINSGYNRFHHSQNGGASSIVMLGKNGYESGSGNEAYKATIFTLNYETTACILGGGVSMDVLELICYNRALNGQEKIQIEEYLASKWEKTQPTAVSGRYRYAGKNGNWSDPTTWLTPVVPTSADSVHPNGYNVTIDTDLVTKNMWNLAPYYINGISRNGTFILSNNISLSALGEVYAGETNRPIITIQPSTTVQCYFANLRGSTYSRTNTSSMSLSGYACNVTFLRNSNFNTSHLEGGFNTNTAHLINSNVTFNKCTFSAGNTTTNSSDHKALNLSGCDVLMLSCTVNHRPNLYNHASYSEATLSATKCRILTEGPFVINGQSVIRNYGAVSLEKPGTVLLTNCSLTSDNIQINTLGQGSSVMGDHRSILYLDGSNSVAYLTAASLGNPLYHGAAIQNNGGRLHLNVGQLKSCAQTTTIINTGTAYITTPYLLSNQSRLVNLITSTGFLTAYTGEIIESNAFGFPPIRANRCVLALTGTNKYMKQAVNRVNSYISYWSPDSTFDFPVYTDVLSGVTYANGTQTGDVIIPDPNYVYFGVPYGSNKTLLGTRSFNLDDFFSTSIIMDTNPDSVATRIKNSITTQALSALTESFTVDNFTTSYSLSHELATVDEGLSVTFALSTYNIANDVSVPYFITGISKNDVITGSLSGEFVTDNTRATTTIVISADNLTEGPETLTLSLYNGVSASVVINDTSITLPTSIPGLQLWLDASDSSTLYDSTVGGSLVTTDGSAIARWQDKSGNNRHAVQGTGNARPILKTNIKNNRNVIQFDGTNDWFSINSIASYFGSSHTIFAIAQTNTGGKNGTTEGAQVVIAGTGYHQTIQFQGYPNATAVQAEAWTAAAGTVYGSSVGSYTLGSWILATRNVINSGATKSVQLFVNNNGNGLLRSWTGTLLTPTTAGIGAAQAVGSFDWFLNGQIAEIIIYNTNLTTEQRQTVQAYLNNKWAIY